MPQSTVKRSSRSAVLATKISSFCPENQNNIDNVVNPAGSRSSLFSNRPFHSSAAKQQLKEAQLQITAKL